MVMVKYKTIIFDIMEGKCLAESGLGKSVSSRGNNTGANLSWDSMEYLGNLKQHNVVGWLGGR